MLKLDCDLDVCIRTFALSGQPYIYNVKPDGTYEITVMGFDGTETVTRFDRNGNKMGEQDIEEMVLCEIEGAEQLNKAIHSLIDRLNSETKGKKYYLGEMELI